MTTPLNCAECATEFQPSKPWARFCCAACQKRFHVLMAKRGAVIMPLLIAAAETRGRYKDVTNRELAAYARSEADALISAWLVDDRAAGRSCASVAGQKMDRGWRAVDVLAPMGADRAEV